MTAQEWRPLMAVTYDGLPLSSGGAHGLGRMSIREAHSRTLDFIAACTSVAAPSSQSIGYSPVPNLPESPELRASMNRQFGDTHRDVLLAEREIESALSFLEEIDPQPRNEWGMVPIAFLRTWKIAILNPSTGEPYPGQLSTPYSGLGYDGGLTLRLSADASLRIEFAIPEIDDVGLRALVPHLQAHAPFRFSPKHWRRWSSTPRGRFVARKIDPM
ncbi:hypothetical protein [Schumannella luteola]